MHPTYDDDVIKKNERKINIKQYKEKEKGKKNYLCD